jgi:hypothetical protein
VLGLRPVLGVEPLANPVPTSELVVGRGMAADERLREASSWNLVASRLAAAGERARREGHPATRRGKAVSKVGKAESDRPLDLGELIATLARHGVEYLVIGGVATQVHGHRRTTMDLDLTPDPSPKNLRRLGAALEEIGARSGGQIHIHEEPKGAHKFDEMRKRALLVDLGGSDVAIASLDDLIRMKRAAGRPSDLDDIAALTEIEHSPTS